MKELAVLRKVAASVEYGDDDVSIIFDTGSPYLYLHTKDHFIRPLEELAEPLQLSLSAAPEHEILGVAQAPARFDSYVPDTGEKCKLTAVGTFAPKLGVSLFPDVDDIPGTVTERRQGVVIMRDTNGKGLACFVRKGRRFILNKKPPGNKERTRVKVQTIGFNVPYLSVQQCVGEQTAELFHKRFPKRGLTAGVLAQVSKTPKIFNSFKGEEVDISRSCHKCLKVSFPKPVAKRVSKEDKKTYSVGEKVHADVKVMPKMGMGRKTAFLVLVDDSSKFVEATAVHSLKEVKTLVEQYRVRQKKQKGVNLTVFKSDCGTEFINATLDELFDNKGVSREKSPPYFKNANGKAEVHVGLIKQMIARLLEHSNLSQGWWVKALDHAVKIINVLPFSDDPSKSRFINNYGFKPELRYFRTFGAVGMWWQDPLKYDTNAFRCLYLTTATWDHKYYRVWDLAKQKERTTPAWVSTEKVFIRSYEQCEREREQAAKQTSSDFLTPQQVIDLFNDKELRELLKLNDTPDVSVSDERHKFLVVKGATKVSSDLMSNTEVAGEDFDGNEVAAEESVATAVASETVAGEVIDNAEIDVEEAVSNEESGDVEVDAAVEVVVQREGTVEEIEMEVEDEGYFTSDEGSEEGADFMSDIETRAAGTNIITAHAD